MPGSPPPIRPHLAELPGYDPVVPLAERCRRVGIPVEQALKLDANENPFGAHPAVRAALMEAVGGSDLLSIYPDPQQVELRRALAKHLAIPAEQIIAGAGADELLDLVMRAVVQPGQTVVTSTPTFGMYRFLADVNEIPLVEVARGAEFHIELEPLLEAAQSAGLLILTSPNNPTGDLFPQGALLELLETGATVLVDEAYVDFARESVIDLVDQYPRLIILRTFSKWAGIAGLRLGYAICHPELVGVLMNIKQPYNINAAAEAAGLAALSVADALNEQADQIVATRDELISALSEQPGCARIAATPTSCSCAWPRSVRTPARRPRPAGSSTTRSLRRASSFASTRTAGCATACASRCRRPSSCQSCLSGSSASYPDRG